MNTDNKRADVFQAMIQALCAGGAVVPVRETRLASRVVLTAFPSARDFGSVIGRKAVTYKALETLYEAAAREGGSAGNFVVEKPDERVAERRAFVRDPKFTVEKATDILLRVAKLIDPEAKAVGVEASSELFVIDVAMDCDERVQEALKVVFNVIGKAHGRDILVGFVDVLVAG